jgi:hypothetical protein
MSETSVQSEIRELSALLRKATPDLALWDHLKAASDRLLKRAPNDQHLLHLSDAIDKARAAIIELRRTTLSACSRSYALTTPADPTATEPL